MDNLNILKSIDTLIQTLKNDSLLIEKLPDCYTYNGANNRLLSFVIHGNETIGLYILEELLTKFHEFPFSFIIANREAVKINKRFVDFDLNRSFMNQDKNGFENLQVKNIESFSQEFDYILDFHQTTHDSENPFCLVRNSNKSNALYKTLQKTLDFPIIFIKNQKLSKDGATFSEFATQHNIGFITLELSKAGYNLEMKELGIKIAKAFLEAKDFTNSKEQTLKAFIIKKSIEKLNSDDCLIQGLNNFTKVEKNCVIASRKSKEIYFDQDFYILFPKYNEYREYSNELCKLMRIEMVTF